MPKKQINQSFKRITASQAREEFSETLGQVVHGHERIVVARHGKDVAAIVPMEDIRLLQALEDRFDIEEANAALADSKKHGTISWEDIKAELGL